MTPMYLLGIMLKWIGKEMILKDLLLSCAYCKKQDLDMAGPKTKDRDLKHSDLRELIPWLLVP